MTYKILAASESGGQILLKDTKYILGYKNILIPITVERMRKLKQVLRKVHGDFNSYSNEEWVFINYELIAFRFTHWELTDFHNLLDAALALIQDRAPDPVDFADPGDRVPGFDGFPYRYSLN